VEEPCKGHPCKATSQDSPSHVLYLCAGALYGLSPQTCVIYMGGTPSVDSGLAILPENLADFLFLRKKTGMTDGNLSSHVSKLEKAGYVQVMKEFVGKKSHTMLELTAAGRGAFDAYRAAMHAHLELPS
jgi:DNA-binding transcriptional ArsR family regulator